MRAGPGTIALATSHFHPARDANRYDRRLRIREDPTVPPLEQPYPHDLLQLIGLEKKSSAKAKGLPHRGYVAHMQSESAEAASAGSALSSNTPGLYASNAQPPSVFASSALMNSGASAASATAARSTLLTNIYTTPSVADKPFSFSYTPLPAAPNATINTSAASLLSPLSNAGPVQYHPGSALRRDVPLTPGSFVKAPVANIMRGAGTPISLQKQQQQQMPLPLSAARVQIPLTPSAGGPVSGALQHNVKDTSMMDSAWKPRTMFRTPSKQ
eukprot:TRINITY_DN3293_c0_g1_i1.p1 TRINITY_DN3293_c0_g1~~TRINITY_DN3293_c0_g1_i1.p1  ORF type:complete len:271 (+),score=76.71 TRINITY_DN3293_c0_g1_i1:437-1249(+)